MAPITALTTEAAERGCARGGDTAAVCAADDYPADDLSWYANIPTPASYMAMGSCEDFFGGYDHTREAGVVHVATTTSRPVKSNGPGVTTSSVMCGNVT